MGLARRAARKLVPVVLTLGSGPSGFPRKLSGRRPKLPRQPRRARVARARSRNFDAGGWPVGLLETTFRATAEASATAMANPRRRTRALRYFGAGGWPVGLPETIFRATAKASATASLALASVVLALGGGPTGFPKKGFRAMQSGGILDADSHGKPAPSHARAPLFLRWRLARRASRNNLPGEASATAMANPRRLILALGAGPSGFPKQVSERRKAGGSWRPPQHMRPEAYVETRAAQIIKGKYQASGRNGRFISDAKRGDLGGRRGICGPKPKSQHGRPRLSRARARPVAAVAVFQREADKWPDL